MPRVEVRKTAAGRRAHTGRMAEILSRSLAATVGGYAFTWGITTLGITGLVALGKAYDQAHTTLMLLAFLIFLGVFLWAFAAKSLIRMWAVLAGGGALMTAAAWALQRLLV
jgi:hypothetical protein